MLLLVFVILPLYCAINLVRAFVHAALASDVQAATMLQPERVFVQHD